MRIGCVDMIDDMKMEGWMYDYIAWLELRLAQCHERGTNVHGRAIFASNLFPPINLNVSH